MTACGSHPAAPPAARGALHAPRSGHRALARDRGRRPAGGGVALAPRARAAAGPRPRRDPVLAAGGLDSADSSMADIVRVAPGTRAARGRAARGGPRRRAPPRWRSSVYVFGGGTAGGPDRRHHAGRAERAHAARRPPAGADVGHDRGDDRRDRLRRRRLHDDRAAALGARLPARARLRATSQRSRTRCATPPSPPSAGACSSPAGTDGTTGARRDPQRRPRPPACASSAASRRPWPTRPARRSAAPSTSSAAAATPRPASARRSGRSIPPRGRVRRAGRLPTALSDLGAVAAGGRLVVGRRPATRLAGRAARPRTLAPRAPRGSATRPRDALLAAVRAAARARRHRRRAPLERTTSTPPTRRRATARAQVRGDAARVYVPNSQSDTVDVIDQRTARIVDHFAVGALPQHVTPSWDLRTLWVTNDHGNSLTPIDPRTGRHGRPVAGRRPLQPVLHRRRAPRDRRRRGPSRARLPRAPHDAPGQRAAHAHVRRRRPHGLHRRRPLRARLLRVRRADGGGRPAPRARRQGRSTCARARCLRTSSSRPTGGRSTSPTWPPTACG